MSDDGNLSGALPKGDANGLGPIVRHLIDEPHRYHVLMAIVDCAKVTTNNDTGAIIPTARIRASRSCYPMTLRPASSSCAARWRSARGVLCCRWTWRTDIKLAFRRIDPRTGERLGGDDPK